MSAPQGRSVAAHVDAMTNPSTAFNNVTYDRQFDADRRRITDAWHLNDVTRTRRGRDGHVVLTISTSHDPHMKLLVSSVSRRVHTANGYWEVLWVGEQPPARMVSPVSRFSERALRAQHTDFLAAHIDQIDALLTWATELHAPGE